MNKRQKEVLTEQLKDERLVLDSLKSVYKKAAEDCAEKAKALLGEGEASQSQIYQARYQQALEKQLTVILEKMNSENYNTVSEYLNDCYSNGFIGNMYDLHGQGIPLILPIDQKQVVQAVQLDSKISEGLYKRMGKDVKFLKKQIKASISRGISNGSGYAEIARNINARIDIGYNKSVRIVRTEGHRIQSKSALDGMEAAKEKGADVVKQWDSTMDNRTRPEHRRLDGQLRELDEDFEVDGKTASAPGHFGSPKDDCNCRCALLQRARWALDDEELDELKNRAEYFGLDKAKSFEDFKERYLKVVDNSGESGIIKNIELPVETDEIKSMSVETKSLISKAFDELNAVYDIRIDTIVAEPLGVRDKNVPFQFQPIRGKNGELIKKIVINTNYDFMDSQTEMQKRIMRNYNKHVLASNSIEGLIAHEVAHVLTFQDCSTYSGFLLANKQVTKRHIFGISDYADASLDGAECIAEAFSAIRCGNKISDEAQKLIDEFIERWRK